MALEVKYSSAINQQGSIITLTNTTGNYDASTNPTGYGGSVNKPVSDNVYTELYIVIKDNTYLLQLDASTLPTDNFIPKNALERTITPDDITDLVGNTSFIDTLIKIYVYEFYSVDGTASINTTSGISTITGTLSTFTNVLTGFGDTTRIKVKNSTQNKNYTINKDSSPAFSNTNIILDQEAEIDNGSVDIYAGYLALTTIINLAQFNACFLPKIANSKVVATSCCENCEGKSVDNLMKMLLGKNAVYAMQDKELYQDAIDSIDTLNAICKQTECKC